MSIDDKSEIFNELELSCTRVKREVYLMRTLILKLEFDAQVMNGLIEHVDKIYREFDSLQEFCKSRS